MYSDGWSQFHILTRSPIIKSWLCVVCWYQELGWIGVHAAHWWQMCLPTGHVHRRAWSWLRHLYLYKVCLLCQFRYRWLLLLHNWFQLHLQCRPHAWDNPPPWDSTHCGLKAHLISHIICIHVSIYIEHPSKYSQGLWITIDSTILIFEYFVWNWVNFSFGAVSLVVSQSSSMQPMVYMDSHLI